MSASEDDATAALRYEYKTLSQQATDLTMMLARRRADVALMRAEAATLAVSLESAKEQLDGLLRVEASIRTKASLSPRVAEDVAKSAPDPGLVRALEGQLDVTNRAVKSALQRKASLQTEIDRLKLAAEKRNEGVEHGQSERNGVGLDASSSAIGARLQVVSGRLGEVDIGGEGEQSQVDITLSQKKRNARHSGELSMLRLLKEGTETKSSFRFDHARIWRDVTMPNLALIPQKSKSAESELSLGVVIERIFEGVTCFTPTATANEGRSSGADLRIESSGKAEPASDELTSLVSKHFGTLIIDAREDSKKVRVVAPRIALERVMDLISGEDTERPRRPRPQLQVESDGADAAEKGQSIDDGDIASPRQKEIAKGPSGVAVKLSDPSHVLHPHQVRQIIDQGVPIRFRESGLRLIYSTNEHGMSLQTLYNRVKTTSPTLLAIRDTRGRVFGCYAASPWKSSSTRYYGTGESFVFGTDGPDVAKVYKWSRANSFFQFSSHTFLAIGGGAGSHFALWVDEDLLMGTTLACSTFASPPLTHVADKDAPSCLEFKIVALEVWGFDAHMSH